MLIRKFLPNEWPLHSDSYNAHKIFHKIRTTHISFKFFIHNLKTSGLIIKKVVDKQTKLVYLLVHTPLVKLLEVAEKTKLKLPIEVNPFNF